jgi:hypothetical protein
MTPGMLARLTNTDFLLRVHVQGGESECEGVAAGGGGESRGARARVMTVAELGVVWEVACGGRGAATTSGDGLLWAVTVAGLCRG